MNMFITNNIPAVKRPVIENLPSLMILGDELHLTPSDVAKTILAEKMAKAIPAILSSIVKREIEKIKI